MSRLHTAVVTTESVGATKGSFSKPANVNLRLCGFASVGRLGPGFAQHAQQYEFAPLASSAASQFAAQAETLVQGLGQQVRLIEKSRGGSRGKVAIALAPNMGDSEGNIETEYSARAEKKGIEIIQVALGQDHTLALTRGGAVLSWGMNRFGQLGYVVDSTTSSGSGGEGVDAPTATMMTAAPGDEYLIQRLPRRVYGPLRREVCTGVAACRTASAAWTGEGDLYTWGTNNGQLGYPSDRSSTNPSGGNSSALSGSNVGNSGGGVQVHPRKVTMGAMGAMGAGSVLEVALSDNAMVCLVESRDVICFWAGRNFRVKYVPHRYSYFFFISF